MTLLLLAIGVLVIGAGASLLSARRPESASVWGAGSALAGSLIGLVPAVQGLFADGAVSFRVPWMVPGGEFYVRMDALSSFFLVPVFLLSGLAAVYGIGYMRKYRDRQSFALHVACFNMFIAGMALVLVARNALLFLLAWEIMSVAAFFLVTFEHEKKDVRVAGWVYLVATHIGAAFLLAMFMLLGRQAGTLDFDFFAAQPQAPAMAGLVFVLALIGFGTKAGVVPLHVWLPEAHPAAPSHVSALMSGVMIKIGIYGILRTMTFLGPPAFWWGGLLMALGMAGAILGVAMALSQRDIKRALAYSSIENVGLILLALGMGLWGLTRGHLLVAAMGFAGGFLHMWNHSLMKGLMFLCAGSVLHGAGTRDMERLGGLMKRMPRTGMAMLIGALALAAIPPLNGFVSEWLIYMGLLRGGLELDGFVRTAMLAAVGGLSLVGGMALVCFVRLTGIVWLGEGRSEEARHAHESSGWLTVPLAVLCVLCVLAAMFPGVLLSAVSGPVSTALGLSRLEFLGAANSALSPLSALGLCNAVVWLALGVCGFLFFCLRKRGSETSQSTWGCGYAAPSPRMQYTGRSFSELLVTRAIPGSLRPKRVAASPRGLFPSDCSEASKYTDPVDRLLYQPFFQWLPERCARLRWVQQGKIHYYMAYFVGVLILAFAWLALRSGVLP